MQKLPLFLFISYIIYVATGSLSALNAQTLTNSNLPIVIINTDIDPNTGLPIEIPDEPKVPASMKIIYRPDGSRNYITDQYNPEFLNYNGRIGIELRGSTSQSPPKKPYALKTLQADDVSNNNVSLLGMPKENNWILNSFAFDPSMLRDYITYKLAENLGDYATRTVYCELIVNDDYKGLYILSEKIKIDSKRVNILKLTTDDNTLPELTGGYITKADKTTGGDPIAWYMSSYGGGWVDYIHHQPKPDQITNPQHEYIRNYFFDLQQAMATHNYSIADGFPSLIDVPTFIDFMIINELASNVDAYRFSTFFHKDRAGKLRAGPVWDFNLSFGNDLITWGYNRSKTDVWQFNYSNVGSKFWKDLFDQDEFHCYFSKRWNDLNAPGKTLHYDQITNLIDSTVAWISEAVEREDQRWNTIGNHIYHINEIKSWLQLRINWLNSKLNNFQACADPFIPPLIISKIHYHPQSDQGFDKDDLEFIEISNHSNDTIDLTGIYLSEPGIVFQFQAYSYALPRQRMYLASNAGVFEQYYGFEPFAEYSRKLSNKSFKLLLKDAWGNHINEVHYTDSLPWPPEADGNGPHLHLIDLNSDNSLPENWVASNDPITAIQPYQEIPKTIIKILPNPTIEKTTLICEKTFDQIKVYNLQGKMIFTQNIASSKSYTLHTASYGQGTYYLLIFRNNKPIGSQTFVVL
ncbi:MAG: CotH kinase family protein [Bacteroidales bacterium]|jgi:spore coat protein CotH|nr:CotH kinase family protein [Bacteroidales bacterium]MDD3701039.1 CotH kinase family protein [Bacteroidales bacterium]MDY0369323.1 CotH kinase family protein [Bacteroidales bacterium]